MKRLTGIVLTVGLLCFAILAGLLSQPDTAEAIPAFARKYQMSCTTCHAPFPRLKPYGDEFAGNGFNLSDKEAPRYFINTGDKYLDLLRELPLAIRLEGYIKYQSNTDRDVDFTAPYNLKLLSGGALGKHVSYYFYFFLSERGEVAGVEDAFIMFNNLFNKEFDVYLGQFQVSDPLFKRELRLTYEDFQIYKTTVGESWANLTYDRGLMLTYGMRTGTDFVVEILNGNGIGEADDFLVYDNDKYKNFFGRASQDINEYLRIGGFAYYGKEQDVNINELWMAGPDASINYKDILTVNLQYIERRDDNPFFSAVKPPEKFETRGGFAELIVLPDGDRSRWYGVALYNQVDSDYDAADYQSMTGHVGYLLYTNIRLIGEYTYDIENEESQVTVGFVSAF